MCFGWICDCIYATRCVWFKLLVPSMLADLGLTIYIVYQLFAFNVFACCVDNKSAYQNSKCAYSNIGGANNVGVDSNGYCTRLDNSSINCGGNLASCGTSAGVNVTELCSQSTLNHVANTSVDWFIAVLIVKMVGLLFGLFMEFKAACIDKKSDGTEDAERSKNCCRKCSEKCFVNLSIFLLRVFFLIFGTAITFVAILLLKYGNSVSFSSCKAVPSSLESQCYTLESSCSDGGDENYYNVVFLNLNLNGSYIADLVTSILTGIIWIARLSVLRYYANATELVDV